jgi:hypothetical protein
MIFSRGWFLGYTGDLGGKISHMLSLYHLSGHLNAICHRSLSVEALNLVI